MPYMISAGSCTTEFPQEDPSIPADFRYFARQPIFDVFNRVYAYELLFRREDVSTFQGDGEFATRTMLDNTVLFGFKSLANGMPAFISCTAETLVGDQVHVLPAAYTILEVLEDVKPTPSVIAACRGLKDQGYRLALDDCLYRPALEALIELADFIKIDYLNTSRFEQKMTLEHLKGFREHFWPRRSRLSKYSNWHVKMGLACFKVIILQTFSGEGPESACQSSGSSTVIGAITAGTAGHREDM